MTNLKKWAVEQSDRAPGSWRDAIARLREALGRPPGSVERDRLLATFFSQAEGARVDAGWANDAASGRHFLHLHRAISGGIGALIDGVAESPDDNRRIEGLLEQHAEKVGEAIERLLRACRD